MDERTNESAKPLPCPFCGAEPEVFSFDDGRFLVLCSNTECKVRPFTYIRDTREQAIADWNARPSDG